MIVASIIYGSSPFPVLINNTNTSAILNPGFRGFVIQAQSMPGENLIGTFMPDAVQLQKYLDCLDSMGNRANVSAS